MSADHSHDGSPGAKRSSAPAGSSVDDSRIDESTRLTLALALEAAVRGDVEFDSSTRAVYSSDSSNYRQVPLGVVFPKDHEDVVAALRVCSAFDAPVFARGAGTSLAGQTCNVAVVLDTSRYLTRILEIDSENRTCRVQPGVVLDDLRRECERYGLTFGPDPATHAWCTLGGMIGNNSCGTHGLQAGKTVDNVERLTAVTYDGTTMDVGAYDDRAYAEAVRQPGSLAAVLGGLRELARRYDEQVRATFPEIPRRVSGFNLDQLLPESGFHVARALVGTESTCVVVTEATLRLTSSPAHRRVVVLGYPDIFSAADAVPDLLAHQLLGLEGFDRQLVDLMRAHRLNVDHLELLPPGDGWLVAELGSDDAPEADRQVEAFLADQPQSTSRVRYDDPPTQRRVWLIRESGLGASAIRTDGSHNLEGWEDAAVAPAQLGNYLRRLTALWQEFGYTGTLYGHFGEGCVHTRNNFELHTSQGLTAYREFVERASDLVVSLGGSLSGEHGDGQARGELLTRMYGPEVVDAFRQFKAVFDPRGRMNPGKVVDPYPLDTNLRLGPSHHTSALLPEHFGFAADAGSLQLAAERCVGVGRCRRDDAGTMCPSYRVTRDERHSTRGRARLLVEMFQGEATAETWRNEDVREALDLCLSCKGCAVDCPTHVDMATYKAEFLAHYYERRVRPRAMYSLGLIAWVARAATRAPRLANAAVQAPVLGRLLRWSGGISQSRPAPEFAAVSWRRALADEPVPAADATVVVWPDTFTSAFRPDAGLALVDLLAELGETVAVPQDWACCGRPLYDMGMLRLAKQTLSRVLDVLEPWIERGVPVVVAEPSCLAAFRDELPALLAGDSRAAALAALSRSPAEHLLAAGLLPPRIDGPPPGLGDIDARRQVVLHPHCHQRALGAVAADVEALTSVGYEVRVLDAGCCGLAGSFGYDAKHDQIAREIGAGWLAKTVAAVEGDGCPTELVMDGFSCRTQLAHLVGPEPTGLVELLRRHLDAQARSIRRSG